MELQLTNQEKTLDVLFEVKQLNEEERWELLRKIIKNAHEVLFDNNRDLSREYIDYFLSQSKDISLDVLRSLVCFTITLAEMYSKSAEVDSLCESLFGDTVRSQAMLVKAVRL